MTARVWPVDAVTGAPSYTGRSLRQSQVAPLLGGATAARPLGGLSGVRPGTATNIVTATSTTWTVTPFAGVIDGETLAIAGPYEYAFDANVTGSVTAAAGSARIDRLDAQVSDPAESDGSSVPGIAVIYNAGVPGSGVPVAAPVRSHPLAYINVPASGGGSPTVSWIAPVTIAAGGTRLFETLTQLTANAGLRTGELADVQNDSTATNNITYRWNGTAWKAWSSAWMTYAPTIAGITLGTGGAVTAKYRYVLGRVEVYVKVVLGTSGALTGAATFTLPVAVGANDFPVEVDGQASYYNASNSFAYGGVVYSPDSTHGAFGVLNATAATAQVVALAAAVPFTWAVSCILRCSTMTYDPA